VLLLGRGKGGLQITVKKGDADEISGLNRKVKRETKTRGFYAMTKKERPSNSLTINDSSQNGESPNGRKSPNKKGARLPSGE